MKQDMSQRGDCRKRGVKCDGATPTAGVSYLIGLDRSGYAILGNFLLSVSVLAEPEPSKDSKMIRELFIALAMLIITVAATEWLDGGPRLSVQQVKVEASLAK